MSQERKHKRREERKFRRIAVRFGHQVPTHPAFAQHISESGLFLSTNDNVYVKDSKIVVEIKSPRETWIVAGIVRHSIKVHPNMARFTKPGMGVELTNIPPACRAFLASL